MEKVIAGASLVNFMAIDIYTNHALEIIKFVISNMGTQTVLPVPDFYETLRMLRYVYKITFGGIFV